LRLGSLLRSKARLAIGVSVLGVVAAVAGAYAQGRNRRPPLQFEVQGNTPYDGRFVFVRLRYDTGFGGGFGRRAPWSHDYPDGEVHFSKILDELTFLHVRTDGSNILSLDDPELFNYPIAYMCEPGFWNVSDTQAANFRSYLLKGGFAIFDDFRGYDWNNLQDQMRQVLPDARWIQLDGKSSLFHSFFEIDHPESLAIPSIYDQSLIPSYWGLFENNDPTKRLMVIANVNNDISEYWEFSDTGLFVVDLSNEAYKFGVNYVIYGMTH
jgi:Domain of unknown function (DUF4159)